VTAATPPRLHAPRSRGEPLRSLIAGRIVPVVIALAVVSAACGSVALASSTGTPSASAADWRQSEPFGEPFRDPPGIAPITVENRSSLPAPYRGVAAHTFVLTADPAASAAVRVNGELRPVLGLRSDEAQLWSLINAARDTFYQLRLAGYRFTVVYENGVQVPGPATVETLTIAPGVRYDVVVSACEQMSSTWLRAIPVGDASLRNPRADTRLVEVEVAR